MHSIAGLRLLSLVSDAYGGYGGIATFNRDFAAAASRAGIGRLSILPRRAPGPPEPLPSRVEQRAAPRGKAAFMARVIAECLTRRHDAVLCGHINLLPAARLARLVLGLRGPRPPIIMVMHGIEVWAPVSVAGLAEVDLAVAVSALTAERFRRWSDFPADRLMILPNTIDLDRFAPGPADSELRTRLGLGPGPVVMTLARLCRHDQDKGIDELLAVLPRLAERHPGLRLLLGGDGDDRQRLLALVRSMGLADRVVLPGFIPEAEKAEHYRLADAFVLCGRQEGFGIVLLEALACGVPVVASKLDGSREAVLDGRLGELSDPDDPEDLAAAVSRALARPRQAPTRTLEETFGHGIFTRKVGAILRRIVELGGK